ncbi:MAG TPA: hypothetical protein DCL38_08545 [Lachnospiraceae bacterium]|nr:hypothetical protein [Lachnospiraceae bacterium]
MADAAMDMFERMAIEKQKTMNAILQFLNQLIRENGLAFQDREVSDSLEKLSEHVKEGGSVKSDMVDMEDAALFESLLKKYRVPFSAVRVSDPSEERERVVYLTRDTDQRLMDLVRKQYFYELGVGLNEISLKELSDYEEGKDVGFVTGLSAEEVELFRYYASDYGFGYAVMKNEDGYDIYFPEDAEKEIRGALRKAAYDLSVPEYREAIFKRIESREAFNERIRPKGREVYVVADADNPNNFITVSEKGFSVHHITADSVTDEKGEVTVSYSCKDREYSSERGKLMSFVEQLKTPVIIKDPKEFGLIRGFGRDGSIVLPKAERIRELYDSMKQELRERAGNKGDYCFTKSFKELLSRENADERQEEIEDVERWALGSDDFYTDELSDRLVAIIERVDEKNFGRRAVDRTFLEEAMEKRVTENLTGKRSSGHGFTEPDFELDR